MTNRQIEETAKFSLDLSKLTLGTWVLGIFVNKLELQQILLSVSGLILSLFFFTMGLNLFKKIP